MSDRSNFNPMVGNLVRIRSYEDMKAEFGADSGGNIRCQFAFTTDMKGICGKEFVIEKVSGGSYLGHGTQWNVSKDMLEYASDEQEDIKENEEDGSMIDGFLCGIKII